MNNSNTGVRRELSLSLLPAFLNGLPYTQKARPGLTNEGLAKFTDVTYENVEINFDLEAFRDWFKPQVRAIEATSFQEGLNAAATFLRGTAADYDQMRERLQGIRNPSNHERKEIQSFDEKAKLLRGQADLIQALKPF